MHPTATLLALHGCQIYTLDNPSLYAVLPRAPAKNITGLFYSEIRGDWDIRSINVPRRYSPCDWSAVRVRKWDVIRPDLLHRFIESITA